MTRLHNSELLTIIGGVNIVAGGPRLLTNVISIIHGIGRHVGSFLKRGFF